MDEERIEALVTRYLLELKRYKRRNTYGRTQLVNVDKIAAMTAVVAVLVRPFGSETECVPTKWAMLTNELYAIRCFITILGIVPSRFNKDPNIEDILHLFRTIRSWNIQAVDMLISLAKQKRILYGGDGVMAD